MKQPILLILIGLFIAANPATGQETPGESETGKLGIKVHYFGEFVLHPGFAAGIDYTLVKKPWFNLHWDSEIGAYFHKWNNNALFLQSTIGTRFITSFSAFVDLNAGIGYMLSSPDGDVYRVEPDGELAPSGRPYNSHLKPNLSLLFGWDGTRKRDIPLLVQIGLEAYWQTHFNQSLLPHAALRAGVVYRLSK